MPSTATTRAPLLGEPLPVELMNTIWADRDGVHDAIADPEQLSDWLAAIAGRADLTDLGGEARTRAAISPADARGFTTLRDALRTLAADVTDDQRAGAPSSGGNLDDAVVRLNESCALAPSWARLERATDGRLTRRSVTNAGPAAATLSRIAELGAALFGSDQAMTLRACGAPGCVLYFVREHPRREWCSAGCGNRARVARHYARHHIHREATP